MKKRYVFVYGTLKQGRGNHRLLKSSTYVGEGITKKKYIMFKLGIPYVSEKQEHSNIQGEIYKVTPSVMRKLDLLEGHPNWYYRKVVDIVLNDGKEKSAYIYFNNSMNGSSLVVNNGVY
tara:strand:+ start:1095 stop:1451 length:357 start_codon:yes stop_codon:yes gene_type:complete